MMKHDVYIDPETLLLNLEEQLKKFPVRLSRVTGKNHEFLGLYIIKPEAASHLPLPQNSTAIKNCEVTTEERFHLFNKATSSYSTQISP